MRTNPVMDTLEDKLADLAKHTALLSVSDRAFADSLIACWKRRNALSDKQIFWVGKLVDRLHCVPDTAPSAGLKEVVPGFSGVMALFNKAKATLKYPKIVLQVGDQEIALSLASEKSKCPGTVNVTDGGPFGNNLWYGRVNADGVWEHNPRVPEDELTVIRATLQGLGEDPAQAARKYGKLTGRCCFCHSKLTDAHSTAAGFGQTCAKNYGLERAWKAAKPVLLAA